MDSHIQIEHLALFEWHGISPSSRFPKQINDDGEKTRKRINTLIAIVRDIEITQTLPTNEMLLALFGEHEIVKKRRGPKLVEKKFQKLIKEEWNKQEGKIAQEQYNLLKEKYNEEREAVLKLLSKVEFVKPRFGNPFWWINTDANELAVLKRKAMRLLNVALLSSISLCKALGRLQGKTLFCSLILICGQRF